MQAAHACAFPIGLRGISEGHDREPLRRAGEPSERIVLVSRMLLHPCEGRRMERLQEKGPDSAHERGQRAVHGPSS